MYPKFQIRPRSDLNKRRDTDLNEKDVELITPNFMAVRNHGDSDVNVHSIVSNAHSLVSSWSELDSSTNVCLDDHNEVMLPCSQNVEVFQENVFNGDTEVNTNNEPVIEIDIEDDNLKTCDNNDVITDDTLDPGKENITPTEEEPGKPEKKKNKKRRKHAKKKPVGVEIDPE